MGLRTKCIYCFKEFLPIEAHFRAKAPVSKAENEIEDIEEDLIYGGRPSTRKKISIHDNGMVVDEKLRDYYKYIQDFDDETAEREARKYPVFTADMDHIISKTVADPISRRLYIPLIELDPKKYKTSMNITNERLCPHCHNKLPKGFGVKDTLIISLIGDTYSGKTVYLTVLINELLNGDGYFESSLIPTGEKSDMHDSIDLYSKQIYTNRRLPDASARKILPPLLYTYTYSFLDEDMNKAQNSIDIALYDIAGENCRDARILDTKGFNVRNSDGIIYLVNPLAVDTISDYYKGLDAITQDTTTGSQLEIINALYNNFLGDSNEKSKIPIAFVMSKADIFDDKKVSLPFFLENEQSKVLPSSFSGESLHKGYLNCTDTDALNNDVAKFMNDTGLRPFVNAIRNYFEVYSFFSTSALNQMPVSKSKDINCEMTYGYLTRDIKPYRVTDPFYWILAKNGYISEFREKRSSAISSGDFIESKKVKKNGLLGLIRKIFG